MRRPRIILTALAVLPLLAAGKCGSAGENPAPTPTQQHHVDRATCHDTAFRADDERCFTIQTFVESRNGPYDVYVKIEGGNGTYPGHIPIAAGGWKHDVVYRAGLRMHVTVTLVYEGGKPSKEGYCSITDGRQYTKDSLRSIRAQGGAPYQAVCNIYTSQ